MFGIAKKCALFLCVSHVERSPAYSHKCSRFTSVYRLPWLSSFIEWLSMCAYMSMFEYTNFGFTGRTHTQFGRFEIEKRTHTEKHARTGHCLLFQTISTTEKVNDTEKKLYNYTTYKNNA